jgi:hypothetical protein
MLHRGSRATKEEIAEALVLTSYRQSRDLESALELLEGRRLAVLEDRTYFPAADLQKVLQRSCELDGSLDLERRQREYHQEERARFQEVLRKADERKHLLQNP